MKILAYLLAIPVFTTTATLAMLMCLAVVSALGGIVSNLRGLFESSYHFAISLLTGAAGSAGVAGLCWLLGVPAASLMFLVPTILLGANDFRRIAAAEAGTSRVAQWSAQDGIEYDPKREGKLEFTKTMGHLAGAIAVAFAASKTFF